MRTSIFVCIISLLLFQSCNSDDDQVRTCENCAFTCLDASDTNILTNECIDDWECNFNIKSNSKVDLGEYDGLASGNKNVFQLIYATNGSPALADDEFTNILVFELDESQASFAAEDGELKAMNTHFRRVCYCVEVDFKEITTGCLQGEKRGDRWFVQGYLFAPFSHGDMEIKIDAQFTN